MRRGFPLFHFCFWKNRENVIFVNFVDFVVSCFPYFLFFIFNLNASICVALVWCPAIYLLFRFPFSFYLLFFFFYIAKLWLWFWDLAVYFFHVLFFILFRAFSETINFFSSMSNILYFSFSNAVAFWSDFCFPCALSS